MVLKGNTCDLSWLNQKVEELSELAHKQDGEGIKSKLKEIIPEYTPFNINSLKSFTPQKAPE